MIPGMDETLFYIDLDEVKNLSDAEVIALCKGLGLEPRREGSLLMLPIDLPEAQLQEIHCELWHCIQPAPLAVHFRASRAAA